MKHSEIRQIFFDYFIKKGHHKVFSSPLVPAKDPTLLFTNAGMNQFKSVFLQEEKREYNRAVSIQKCMRVSGKHNDFDEVGKTEFHHTFFEMMGNFSFGDYFKEEAIAYGWELLTGPYGFQPADLWVTVYENDDEAFRIWEKEIGVPVHKIVRMGEKTNFWQMGETGPCGPCSEIHIDRGSAFGPAEFYDGNRRYMEVWNLVFMQYFREPGGHLKPLPAPSIDTGMGMERLTALLQGKSSNYQSDLFRPIIEFTAELAGVDPDAPQHQVDLKVIADHIRALSFLISDGVLPANDGRGYVLRRVLRRAAKHGKALGFNTNFLSKVSGRAIDIMKESYPELEYNRSFIAEVLQVEEERFNHTLSSGLKRFEDLLEKSLETENGERIIPGSELFKLSDTYGFPLDFAVDLANEKEIGIDYKGYQEALEDQKQKSRQSAGAAQKQKAAKNLENIDKYQTLFTGYENLEEEAVVVAIYTAEKSVSTLEKDREGILIFDKTPFYAESGGQVGDTGLGKSDNVLFEIKNTHKTNTGAFLHMVQMKTGALTVGDKVHLTVDRERRKKIAVHHSVTHLLHSALREVLGLHVKQAGSYVGPDKLRFDFTHFKSLTPPEIEKIELIINRKIRENIPVNTDLLKYEEAITRGAIAIFEEKYSDVVRMLSIGDFSRELCGGTHLTSSGEAGIFKISAEYSISSGIRRIEAAAGEAGFLYIQQSLHRFQQIQDHFHQKDDKLLDYLVNMESSIKEKEKELKKKKDTGGRPVLEELIEGGTSIDNVHVVIAHLEDQDRKQLSALADEIKSKTKGIVVLSSNTGDKSAIIVSLDKELTAKINANNLVKGISQVINGSGGGRPDFAQAGGNLITDVLNFKKQTTDIIKEHLKN
ncbi:MAG: alanine--tRNA ligase [Acidobacteria bacterium]|jgi:alanyl-tRNA synthetase|nr:alanine--tRNA ligase [Acidobacteriota bacterium]